MNSTSKGSRTHIEELIPIVAELTEKYTSKESTSVTYDTARQLMGAVLYCIMEYEKEIADILPATLEQLSAKAIYTKGYQHVINKAGMAQRMYNEMIVDFCAYGNDNYSDTVEKGIPAFFLYYNAQFEPQNTIITMDYPTLCPIYEYTGVDAIYKYIEYITLEQEFLNKFPKEYIISLLHNYQEDYHSQFYNISQVVLRSIIGSMLLGKKISTDSADKDYQELKDLILNYKIESLEEQIYALIRSLVNEKYDGNEDMFNYFCADVKNFSYELKNAAKYNKLNNVIAYI